MLAIDIARMLQDMIALDNAESNVSIGGFKSRPASHLLAPCVFTQFDVSGYGVSPHEHRRAAYPDGLADAPCAHESARRLRIPVRLLTRMGIAEVSGTDRPYADIDHDF
jgi:hypothetical protein